MRGVAWACLLVLWLPVDLASTPVHQYTLRVPPELERLTVRYCLPNPGPACLQAEGDHAVAVLQWARGAAGRRLSVQGRQLDLGAR